MNRPLIHPNKALLQLACAVLLVVSACAAKAQILLTIDDSNANAVVITANISATGTSTASQAIALNEGIDLLQFFQSSVGQNFNLTANPGSTLTGVGTTPADVFTDAFGDDYTIGNGYVDLNLFNSGSGSTLNFVQGTQGFSGTLTLDLSGVKTLLPTDGTSGTLITGFYDDGNNGGVPITTIGTWKVENTVSAPEPASWFLVALSILAFAAFRLRARLPRKA